MTIPQIKADHIALPNLGHLTLLRQLANITSTDE